MNSALENATGMLVGSLDTCRWTAEVFHEAATGLMMENCVAGHSQDCSLKTV